MRLMCIDNKPWPTTVYPDVLKYLQEGKDYEVDYLSEGLDVYGKKGVTVYLVGVRSYPHGFSIKRFIPLSDIDELQLVNTKEECV